MKKTCLLFNGSLNPQEKKVMFGVSQNTSNENNLLPFHFIQVRMVTSLCHGDKIGGLVVEIVYCINTPSLWKIK